MTSIFCEWDLCIHNKDGLCKAKSIELQDKGRGESLDCVNYKDIS